MFGKPAGSTSPATAVCCPFRMYLDPTMSALRLLSVPSPQPFAQRILPNPGLQESDYRNSRFCVSNRRRDDSAWKLISMPGLLGHLRSKNGGCLLWKFDHKSRSSECPRFPLGSIASKAPQLGVGAADSSTQNYRQPRLRNDLGAHNVPPL